MIRLQTYSFNDLVARRATQTEILRYVKDGDISPRCASRYLAFIAARPSRANGGFDFRSLVERNTTRADLLGYVADGKVSKGVAKRYLDYLRAVNRVANA